MAALNETLDPLQTTNETEVPTTEAFSRDAKDSMEEWPSISITPDTSSGTVITKTEPEYSTELPDDYPFESPVEDTTPVTQIKTPTEDTLTSVPKSEYDFSHVQEFRTDQVYNWLTGDFKVKYDEPDNAKELYKKSLGWEPSWKAHVDAEGKLVPLKEATNIGGTDNTATNRRTNVKGQAWHHYGTANRTEWSAEGYETPYDILSDPSSNISKVRWVGDNSLTQKQQSKDYHVNTAGANTDYKFSEHQKDLFLVYDKKAEWKIVSGAELTNPHHEAANPHNIEADEPADPLAIYLRDQVVDPAIPASAQQVYQDIVTKPNEFLTETDKKIAEDLKISLQEAAKSKILLTSTGAYDKIDPDDIEGLKNLVASTYEDNVNLISDNQAGNAEAEAQLIEALTKSVTAAQSTGLTQEATAAARDTTTEQEAMADTQEGITADTITGQEGVTEQVGDVGGVGEVQREVSTIDTPMEAAEQEQIQVKEVGTIQELEVAKMEAKAANKSVNEITDPITGVTRLVDTITGEIIAQGPVKAEVGRIDPITGLNISTATAVQANETSNQIIENVAEVTKQVSTIDRDIIGESAQVTDSEINQILDGFGTKAYAATTGNIKSGTAAQVSGSEKVDLAVRDIAQGNAAVGDLDDVKVVAAIAELPTEALVSTQLDMLLSDIEDDEIPAWARPAVDKVDALLAQRGMGKSSIARDALFNAIITAATPIAQANAQSMKDQAFKNQENQQRVNELQGSLNRDIVLANLSNTQAMEVENLRAMNAANSEAFGVEQQAKLKEYDTLINFKIKNADFAQQMEQVNLSGELQLELANLSAMNTADAANMSADNQLRLTKLNEYVKVVAGNAELQQQMALANLDMEGKVAFANLQSKQQADAASMSFEEKRALTEYQTKVQNGQFNANLAQALGFKNLDVNTNVALANMQAENESYRQTFTAEQQKSILEWQATVDADKFFQQQAQAINLANLDMEGKVAFANLAALNAANAEQMSADQQTALAEYQTKVQNGQFNTNLAQALKFKNLDISTNAAVANMAAENEAFRATFSKDQQNALAVWQAGADADKLFAQLGQDIELTNLDMKGKVAFANLSALNEANRDQMTVDQQTQLAEFQAKVDVGKYNAELAQQMGIANLNNKQQAAVQNAMNNLNIDMRKFELDQQVELANSQFLQTMTATDLSNRQQAAILNATNMASMDITDLNNQQQAQVENAQNFLKMDLTNVSNAQQAELFNDQWNQQVLLSNQAVENAAKQFASTSQNDINKFISSMEVNIETNNAARNDAMEQVNLTEKNKTAALNQANNESVELFNAQLRESVAKYQEQVNFQRESFNASMTHQIDSSNVTWRRNINTANTAGANAVNQANAINAFNLSNDSMNKLWQEMRDQAQWEWQSNEQDATRKAQMALSVLGNENAEMLAKLKIDADDATGIGEGLFNVLNGVMSGEWDISNVTKYF